jgi:hypothetical protein
MHVPTLSLGLRRFALLLLAVCVAAVALVQGANATTITLATFTKPGTYVWAVPKGVTRATFTVYGASGGWAEQRNPNHTLTTLSQGGLGGEAKATFTVHAGEKFEIAVGGQGGTGWAGLNPSTGLGGANGGGSAGYPPYGYGGGGGGGSDVRLGGRGNTCAATKSCGYGDRIIVGGGGGGGGDPTAAPAPSGLAGGGLTGAGAACPANNGSSAAQECAGNTGRADEVGQFGVGGAGEKVWNGGGGGGWYGGAAGDWSGLIGSGGGSGYISAFAKSGSFPGGHQTGDGRVIVTTTK